MNNPLGLVTLCAGLVIAGCGDDGNNGGSGAGGNPSGGSAQGAGPQGAGSQGGDGPVAGSPEGGASQGGSSQGGNGQGGSSQGGNGQGGASQGGNGQGGDGGGGGAPPALTCQTGCEALFACALEDDSGGNQNCPGLQVSDQAFLVPGCVQQCNENMALLLIIDPSDCEGTIDTLSTLNAQFADACQNGI